MADQHRFARLRAEAAAGARAQTAADAGAAGPDAARRNALRRLDAELRRIPPADRAAPACAAGCAMCCHLRVAATPAEVFGLLDFLEAQLDREAFEAFRARVAETAARVRALPPERRLATNLPCPVLVDGRCSGYPARPLNCRAYHSLDLAACEASFRDPANLALGHPQNAADARVHEGTQRGFIDGLREAGFDAGQRELVTALDEALGDDQARVRFLAKGRAFLTALEF